MGKTLCRPRVQFGLVCKNLGIHSTLRGKCLQAELQRQSGRPSHPASRRHLASLAEQFQTAVASQRQVLNVHSVFRTQENDPTNHSMAQEGLFYTIPEADVRQILQKGLSVQFARQSKTFNETCLMVRRPALELIDYLKKLDFDHTAPRFMLYGNSGSGKTMTLAHVLLFCAKNNWMIVHAPFPSDWCFRYHETSPSPHKAGRIDLPVDAAEWLVNFRSQNLHFLKDIRVSQRYLWTKREVTEAGSPLGEVVDFGLSRMKFASDCIGAILKEVRIQAAKHKFKLLVAIDGVNAFWCRTTIKNAEKELLMADQLSLVHNFKKMLLPTWTHGAIVCSVDALANPRDRRDLHTPNYLLGKEGFKWMDPFIPIHVPYYSEKEAYSCIEYYLDRNWIQHEAAQTEEGKKELIFLSNRNPFQLMRICSSK